MMVLFSVILVILDQLTKFLTVKNLKPVKNIDIIPNILSLTYVENRGAAFGILQNARWFFIVATVVFLLCLTVYILKVKPASPLFRLCASCIYAGAVGNLIDRIAKGYVVDMIRVHFFDFPVFNFADCLIVAGAVLFAVYIIFYDKQYPKGMK